MTKTERINLRAEKEIYDKLVDFAKEDNRSLSNYILDILIKHVQEKEGYNG